MVARRAGGDPGRGAGWVGVGVVAVPRVDGAPGPPCGLVGCLTAPAGVYPGASMVSIPVRIHVPFGCPPGVAAACTR